MSQEPTSPALFDTYNARFMEPRQIARSFVIPSHAFGLLCKNENSILIGPRGSGKTTLMKMLRPGTLKEWQHAAREQVLDQIKFSSVYIGAESGWSGRLAMFSSDSEEHRILEVLQSSTVVTYALDSMLNAIVEGVSLAEKDEGGGFDRFRIQLSGEAQRELSHQLGKMWLLAPEVPSIRSLRFAIKQRIHAIDELYFRVSMLRNRFAIEQLASETFLSVDVVSAIQSFVEVVNEISERPTRTWAFCLDEIEILPGELQTRLVRSFRSVSDQRIRFKLSASPFARMPLPAVDSTIPMGGHDFTPITLTYARKHEAVRFGKQMLDALLKEVGTDHPPAQLFGESQFEPELPRNGRAVPSRYRPGGVRFKALSELEKEDPGFAAYLGRRGINLNEVAGLSEEERAEVRKLIQIAEIRKQFGVNNLLSLEGREVLRHRSRKRVGDLYTGAESLLTVCEGNPRWLIGIFRPLLAGANDSVPVSRSKQARSISTAIARYLALLSTIPFVRPNQRSVPVTKMIDRIGEYFFLDITAPRFKTEPALSFTIDPKVSQEELDSIGAALNQGAFIFIPSQENEHCLGDIRNKRFRLSYMLSPRYKLPLMYGQPVRLSRILDNKKTIVEGQFTLADLVDAL